MAVAPYWTVAKPSILSLQTLSLEVETMVKALDGVIMIEFYFRLSMSNKDTLKSLLLQANEENGI